MKTRAEVERKYRELEKVSLQVEVDPFARGFACALTWVLGMEEGK